MQCHFERLWVGCSGGASVLDSGVIDALRRTVELLDPSDDVHTLPFVPLHCAISEKVAPSLCPACLYVVPPFRGSCRGQDSLASARS